MMIRGSCHELLADRWEQRGASATEYGLLVIFIVMAATIGVSFFGEALSDLFEGLVTSLGSAGVF